MHRLSTLLQVILICNIFTSYMVLDGIIEHSIFGWSTILMPFNLILSAIALGLLRRDIKEDDEA